jgi:hypothetical protein
MHVHPVHPPWVRPCLKSLQIRAQATLDSVIGSLELIPGLLYKYGLRLHWIVELFPWN